MSAKTYSPEKVHALLDVFKQRSDTEEKNYLIDRLFDRICLVGGDEEGDGGFGLLGSPAGQEQASQAQPAPAVSTPATASKTQSPSGNASAKAKTNAKALTTASGAHGASKGTSQGGAVKAAASKPVPAAGGSVQSKVSVASVARSSVAPAPKSLVKAGAAVPLASIAAAPQPADGEKRGRGRPRKTPVPKYPETLRCLYLADDMGITDDRTRKTLEQIAIHARGDGGGRGLPMTENPDSYLVERRGGPKPVSRAYVIDGQRYEIEPPIVSKGAGGETNAMWIEFEIALLGIREKRHPSAETQKRQTEISFAPGVKEAKFNWVEGNLSDGSLGIPSIHAQTAREILSEVSGLDSYGADFLNKAPAAWVTPEGVFTDQFSGFLRAVWFGSIKLGRKERFALARLLMEPLGSIERRIQEIAFDERFEDRSFAQAQLQAAQDAGAPRRGRPKGSKNKPEDDAAKASVTTVKAVYSTKSKGPAKAGKKTQGASGAGGKKGVGAAAKAQKAVSANGKAHGKNGGKDGAKSKVMAKATVKAIPKKK